MTRRARRSREAEADLAVIVAYVAGDNPTAAIRLSERLDDRAQLLAEQPGIGRAHPTRAEIRVFGVGEYLILYREMPDGIEVLRYLHGRRDLARIL